MILTNACEPVSCTSSSKCTKSRYALQDGFDINYYIVPGRRMILNMRLSLHMQVNRLNYQGVHTLGPQPTFLEHGSCLTFCSRLADATGSYELQTSINAQEAGAKDMQSFPYSSYSYDNVLPSLLPHIIRTMVINFVCSARAKLTWIKLALVHNLVMMIQVHGQPSSGFISVKCGFTNTSSYTDSTTRTLFLPHGEFVDGGVRNKIVDIAFVVLFLLMLLLTELIVMYSPISLIVYIGKSRMSSFA